VQIGGGVRVGDAFQAIVGSTSWQYEDRGSVSKFLRRGIAVSFASNKRDTHRPAEKRAEGEAKWAGLSDGVATERLGCSDVVD
jgi:hypothetical protein